MEQKTVLLVEDDAQIREMLAITLDELGVRVSIAATPEDGLAIAGGGIDLLILDFMLEGVTGDVFLEKFREFPNNAGIPVLIISGADIPPERIAALQIDFLQKPFPFAEFQAKVSELLK